MQASACRVSTGSPQPQATYLMQAQLREVVPHSECHPMAASLSTSSILYVRLPRLFADTHSGFVPFFRNKFPGLSQASESFFPGRILQSCWIFPSDCSSMSFKKTLLLGFTDFQDFLPFQGISSPENATLKFKYFPEFPGRVSSEPCHFIRLSGTVQ